MFVMKYYNFSLLVENRALMQNQIVFFYFFLSYLNKRIESLKGMKKNWS